jgi:hypothetical protein
MSVVRDEHVHIVPIFQNVNPTPKKQASAVEDRIGITPTWYQNQTRDKAYVGKKHKGKYKPGELVQTFDRQPAGTPRQSFAFTGRGFLPDLHNVHGMVTLQEASTTTLENEGVHGREGMMPVPGHLNGTTQSGQKLDSGSGGAGSFATASAFGARFGG